MRSIVLSILLATLVLSFLACSTTPPVRTERLVRRESGPMVHPEPAPTPRSATRAQVPLSLMPYPRSLHRVPGRLVLRTVPEVELVTSGKGGDSAPPGSARVSYALELLSRRFSLLGVRGREDGRKGPPLTVSWSRTVVLSVGMDESYSLDITRDGIALHATTDVGVLRGLATLSQLVSAAGPGEAELPFVDIRDAPRFPWRGLLLDCVRHFMPVKTIKRTLLGMAAVKLNVFHWHLTDDQGFRVQSLAFPRLTEVGSNGQYYTQEEVRDVVSYADRLGIRVVPEFDMPAHTSALLAAYPDLGAGPGPYRVQDGFGVFDAVLDPSNEQTYRGIQTFLAEMATLFPDRYVHIGGDENTHRAWRRSSSIAAFMHGHGIDSYHALSGYFTVRIEDMLSHLGRTAVEWEEAWDGEYDPSAVVQVWSDPDVLRKAMDVHQPVIRSQRYYLDLLYPASYHYIVDPEPRAGDTHTAKAIGPGKLPIDGGSVIGGEAAMWTELVSPENLDSRLWPRLAAIAERFWSPRSTDSLAGMYDRLPAVNAYLAEIGMKQFADERRLLVSLAGGTKSGPLETLARVLEPFRGYGRISTQHYTTRSPLDRMVDAIPPESVEARRFADEVNRYLADIPLLDPPPGDVAANVSPTAAAWRIAYTMSDRKRTALLATLRRSLEEWRRNDARLTPLLAREDQLQELIGVSSDLVLASVAGLRALDRLSRYPTGVRPAYDAAWLANELVILRGISPWTAAQVRIAILPSVRRLVYAACGVRVPEK